MRQKKLSFVFLGLLALGLVGCDQLRARDNVNKGVRAFGASNYSEAVEYFGLAVEFDPELTNAELYLGMAYLQQFIPNAVGEENQRHADMAVQTFQSVLGKEPENTIAISGLASIYQNMNQLDLARENYLRQTEIAPDDPVAHYSVGSLNWMIVFDKTTEETPEELAALIEEGQQHLDRALELRENYEDAMSYKNLLYRQAAELIPEDSEDGEALARREDLIAMADEWFDRALETRQRNAELAAAGLLDLE